MVNYKRELLCLFQYVYKYKAKEIWVAKNRQWLVWNEETKGELRNEATGKVGLMTA